MTEIGTSGVNKILMEVFKMNEKETGISYARLVEIATLLKDGLICDDEESAMEYMADTIELTEKEVA